MIEVEYKKGNICTEYTDYQSVAFPLNNYEEARTETEKCFYAKFSEQLETSLQKHKDVKGKPFLGNVVSSEIKEGNTAMLIQMYVPTPVDKENNSDEALLRACFLKAAFEAEKLELKNMLIATQDINFPENQLKEIVTEVSETIKSLTSKWKFLKKVTFLEKA